MPEEGTVEERWEVMHSALLESADELLGYGKRDNQISSKSQWMSLGLSYSGGIMLMIDGWLQERKRS